MNKKNPFDKEYKKFLELSGAKDSPEVREIFGNGFCGGLNFVARLVIANGLDKLQVADVVGKYTVIIAQYMHDPEAEAWSPEIAQMAAQHIAAMRLMQERDGAGTPHDAPSTKH